MKKHTDAEKRNAISALNKGATVDQVAKQAGVTPKTIRAWRRTLEVSAGDAIAINVLKGKIATYEKECAGLRQDVKTAEAEADRLGKINLDLQRTLDQSRVSNGAQQKAVHQLQDEIGFLKHIITYLTKDY